MKKQIPIAAILSAVALVAVSSLTSAQPAAPGAGGPPGAYSRGYGPGMMGGYGPGQGGYGPGTAGGYRRGAGGWGMGSMMGMMGVPGYGMMGMGPYYALDLTEQQRGKISQIQDEMRKKHWDVMGKLVDEQSRLRELYAAEKPDPAAIGKQTMKIADLRRQLVEASVDVHNRIAALLSKEQKEHLRSFGPGWMMGDDD